MAHETECETHSGRLTSQILSFLGKIHAWISIGKKLLKKYNVQMYLAIPINWLRISGLHPR